MAEDDPPMAKQNAAPLPMKARPSATPRAPYQQQVTPVIGAECQQCIRLKARVLRDAETIVNLRAEMLRLEAEMKVAQRSPDARFETFREKHRQYMRQYRAKTKRAA